MKLDNSNKITVKSNKWTIKIFLFLLFVICYLLFVHTASAQYVSYPVPELGNCRNAQECHYYCQIPTNTPTCWSYGKYVLPQVLGEQTATLEDQAEAANITFPIPELGNCQSALACFTYCSQAKNQSACRDFARKNGLAKPEEEEDEEEKVTPEIIQSAQEELGCTSRASCQSICSQSENYEKCHTFAKKHKLAKENEKKGPPAEVVEAAQTELGCTDQLSCSNFCQNKQNREKCYEFAKKHRLIDEEKRKTEWEQEQEKRQKLMEEAQQRFGCDSFDSCKIYCSDAQHRQECGELARKHEDSGRPSPTNKPPLPCTGDQQCKEYCQNHQDECKGFEKSEVNSQMKKEDMREGTRSDGVLKGESSYERPNTTNKSLQKSTAKTGDFLGPSGCRSEGECKAYCEKHPSECPGFPKITPSTSAEKSKTNTSSSDNPTQSSGKSVDQNIKREINLQNVEMNETEKKRMEEEKKRMEYKQNTQEQKSEYQQYGTPPSSY